MGVEFSIKTSSIKLQNVKQIASIDLIDEFQKRVARYVDERLGLNLQVVNLLDNLLNTKIIEHILLEE